jgi:hypothetical protein
VDAGELAAATAAANSGAEAGAPPDTGSGPTTGAPSTTGTTVHRDPTGGGSEDIESARLIALNMALDGTSREETDRYLAEHYKLSDRAALLDEVYESVGG